jgi:EmrB/QacA subfamily drug resistance transporter
MVFMTRISSDAGYKRIIPFVVAATFFMEALDTTIINTAIPTISRSLKVHPVDLKITLISYLLSLAVFIPISGWLADKLGAKRVLLTAITLFTLASLGCGYSQTLPELVFARLMQGLGGAMILPVGRLILARSFASHELIETMSRVMMVGALGVILGPVLGGIITYHFSWHWIFWVNVPVGLFTIALISLIVPAMPPQKIAPLDKIGFVLFGLSLAGFTFSASIISQSRAYTTLASVVVCFSVVLLMLYIYHSRHKAHPIVKTDLLRLRTFRISVLGNLFTRLGFSGIPFIMPLLFQIALGYSSQLSGLLIAPMALGVFAMKPLALRLMRFFGYKKFLIINTLLVGTTVGLFMLITKATPLYVIVCGMFGYGLLSALQYNSMNLLAYSELPDDQLSSATSIMATLQKVSQCFAVAVVALALRYFSTQDNGSFVLDLAVFHNTFLVMGLMTGLTILIYMKLNREDGRGMIYKTEPRP